jgi:hypothetical protein
LRLLNIVNSLANMASTEDPTRPRGGLYSARNHNSGRAAARVPSNREETRRLDPPPPRVPPVFVDDSGRRGRWLALVSVTVAMLGLLFIAAFWISQVSSSGLSVLGLPVLGTPVA